MSDPALMNAYTRLRMTSKQVEKQMKKARAKAESEKKKAIAAMNGTPPKPGIARIYLTSHVRHANNEESLLGLLTRIQAVQGRVETALTMRSLTDSMRGTVRGMRIAKKSMNPESVEGVMDEFTSLCEDMDVVGDFYEGVTGGIEAQGLGTEGDKVVDSLMDQIKDGAQVDIHQAISSGVVPGGEVAEPAVPAGKAKEEVDQDELNARLAALRG